MVPNLARTIVEVVVVDDVVVFNHTVFFLVIVLQIEIWPFSSQRKYHLINSKRTF